ncbi:HNH endonuclease [Natrarchaeobaculum sulfurireducens]|uniref:5-methylcytosine-specific restriction enzyme A n=1 Tax=Natrarchaeobaculum sulfurireducens TaxID=2044521 RepID=A0A346PS05_9EURY|nr:HNH endonuclease [Natrarchaeobaculum sulfurireducens]AXR82300.1 5-methylcytosine-specific restriction enzyme A [Natrarchaeobaculum sulfurireducens]
MIEGIPAVSALEEGETYHRVKLHEKYGGARYRGIAPCKDHPYVFIFTGDSGEEYGYLDEFRGDTFVYTGEGREGDMEMTQGNKAIRDHRKDGREIHLFESNEEAWSVTYVGQFEYAGWFHQRLEDTNGNYRKAICFELEPVDNNVEIETDDLGQLDLETLYERAKGNSAPEALEGETTATKRITYSRSKPVKEYALRVADGVCQGCEEPAPFIGKDGEPFLEVHHLHRRSDGGPDNPDNVVALCPNCHRRVHHGQDKNEFNNAVVEKIDNK